MAEKTIAQGMEDLVTVYQTLFLDLPLASAKWGLGGGGEKDVAEVAWKGYDAWVRLATAAGDNLYRTPLFGEAVARSFDSTLRWQRLNNALVGVSSAGLWQVLGLPTAAAVQGLRAEVQALREELRSSTTDSLLTAPSQTNSKLAAHPLVSPCEKLHPPTSGLFIRSKKSMALTTDLSEYFEPVNDATSAPDPEQRIRTALAIDLSEYFEPVEIDTQSVSDREQRESKEREAVTTLDAQREALLAQTHDTEHSPPPQPPYNRAGGHTAHKKTAKGHPLR